VKLHAFSTSSSLDEGKWSASRLGRFTRQGNSPWYPPDRRLGGLQSRSGRGGEGKEAALSLFYQLTSYTPQTQLLTRSP
jgi:hypothetical protein